MLPPDLEIEGEAPGVITKPGNHEAPGIFSKPGNHEVLDIFSKPGNHEGLPLLAVLRRHCYPIMLCLPVGVSEF